MFPVFSTVNEYVTVWLTPAGSATAESHLAVTVRSVFLFRARLTNTSVSSTSMVFEME